jgi:hypothetical protein
METSGTIRQAIRLGEAPRCVTTWCRTICPAFAVGLRARLAVIFRAVGCSIRGACRAVSRGPVDSSPRNAMVALEDLNRH